MKALHAPFWERVKMTCIGNEDDRMKSVEWNHLESGHETSLNDSMRKLSVHKFETLLVLHC